MRLFNFVLLPYQFPPVDLLLAEVDGALGFHWSSYARMMAEFPSLSSLLFFVYTTSYWQMVALIFLLGLFGKTTSIKQFMLANIIGGLLTTLIWFFLPSSTPAAFQPLPDGIDKQLDLFLNGEYGRWLVRIGQDGLSYLSPEVMGGIVGFPSFHTVMAIIIVRYSREVPYAVIPFGILNALMFPAILLHGAHNLVDVFGGIAVVWAAIWMAETISDAQPQDRESGSALWLKPKNLAITKPGSPFAETAMAQMSEIGGVRM